MMMLKSQWRRRPRGASSPRPRATKFRLRGGAGTVEGALVFVRCCTRGRAHSGCPEKRRKILETKERSYCTVWPTRIMRKQLKEPIEKTAPAVASAPLSQTSPLLQLLVDTVRDYAIILLDPQGKVLTWNVGAERLKGWKANEIIGEHFSRF